jgi:hypothetical protein
MFRKKLAENLLGLGSGQKSSGSATLPTTKPCHCVSMYLIYVSPHTRKWFSHTFILLNYERDKSTKVEAFSIQLQNANNSLYREF